MTKVIARIVKGLVNVDVSVDASVGVHFEEM
jgi:hypothetical protein